MRDARAKKGTVLLALSLEVRVLSAERQQRASRRQERSTEEREKERERRRNDRFDSSQSLVDARVVRLAAAVCALSLNVAKELLELGEKNHSVTE